MSKHIFSAGDNTDKLTMRQYGAFGWTLGVFIDSAEVSGYGEVGSRMVALSLDEAKNLRDLLEIAIEEADKEGVGGA